MLAGSGYIGIGYLIGCFISIVLWKIDRLAVFKKIDSIVKKIIKNSTIVQLLYLSIVVIIFFIIKSISVSEIFNALTAFVIIDISNTERKTLKIVEKVHFYDSISIITRSLVAGFTAPLLYVLLFGNNVGIFYMIIYNIAYVADYKIIKAIFNLLTIIPALITEIFLYIIYIVKNKSLFIEFKGDYFRNFIKRPLLNVDILGAYVEMVNFYYFFNNKESHYVKCYGKYNKNIDLNCIKDYLSITYGISMIFFVTFYILHKVM